MENTKDCVVPVTISHALPGILGMSCTRAGGGQNLAWTCVYSTNTQGLPLSCQVCLCSVLNRVYTFDGHPASFALWVGGFQVR